MSSLSNFNFEGLSEEEKKELECKILLQAKRIEIIDCILSVISFIGVIFALIWIFIH